ncbi:hypothetical protein R1sor_017899 [Riccia sorocarpa]|uniref:Uncharacterized protein n=1 Tax=Riccia sorocarpa TaxID=122646 RepID=A0ABD3IAY9_9MARC
MDVIVILLFTTPSLEYLPTSARRGEKSQNRGVKREREASELGRDPQSQRRGRSEFAAVQQEWRKIYEEMAEGRLLGQEGPSPVIPIVILGIVGVMLSLSNMFEVDPNYMQETLESIQSHFFLGALLIPVCILLIIQAVGMPSTNMVGPPVSFIPIVQSLMQDPTTSLFLFAVILCLLVAIPFHNYIHAPWQTPAYYDRRY